jgi:hypothetical protein
MADIKLGSELGVELDILYLNHSFSQLSSEFFGESISSNVSSGAIHIPAMFRYRPLSLLNLGAGAYYSRVVSHWTVSAPGFTDTTTDFGKNDYGIVFGIGTEIPVHPSLVLVADFRYAKSLDKITRSSGAILRFSELQLISGIRFYF